MTEIKFKVIDNMAVEATNKDKRKTRKLREELSKAIRDIKAIIRLSEQVKGSYFWTDNGNAYNRVRRAEALSFACSYESRFVSYQLEQKVEMSRRNVYVSKTYIINQETTNLRKVKTLLEELKSLLKIFEEPKSYKAYLSNRDKRVLEQLAA